MMIRRHDDESSPSALMGIAFAAVLLVVGCTDAFADLLVTDLRGPVSQAGSPQGLVLMQTLKPGAKLALPAGSSVELYDAASATVQPVAGPARLLVTAQGVKAESGTLGPARKLGEVFRHVKVDSRDVSLGSLRMRSADARVLEGPEGIVPVGEARLFRWKAQPGIARFELATREGDLVHRARATGSRYELPEAVRLEAGRTYVWGVAGANEADAPIDWTEFRVGEPGAASLPGPEAGATERVLRAAALRSAGLARAAQRADIP